MTGPDFQALRDRLGLSARSVARLFRVSGERTVRRWETGDRDIPGPAQVLIECLASGRLPDLEPYRKRQHRPRHDDGSQ
jgi:DNA-binding transcriptional regulator YiaG